MLYNLGSQLLFLVCIPVYLTILILIVKVSREGWLKRHAKSRISGFSLVSFFETVYKNSLIYMIMIAINV